MTTNENTSSGASNSAAASEGQAEKLRSLKRRLDDGLITDDEYVTARAHILDPR